jgi:hypothetical protein
MEEIKRTELPESSHVGEHGLDVHSDNSLSDLLDSIDNLLSALVHVALGIIAHNLISSSDSYKSALVVRV